MATWLYQINQQQWPPEKYRTDIWEGEEETWPVGRLARGDSEEPQPGDVVVFFYAPTGGWDWGFYGWAVIVGWHSRDEDKEIRFRPTSPSDRLKMDPWCDREAKALADEIRGRVKQGTMWKVPDHLVPRLRSGLVTWAAGVTTEEGERVEPGEEVEE
jgi:hypothetical protein